MTVNKVIGSFDEAVSDIPSGATLLIGDFAGPAENPSYLIAAVARRGKTGLTVISNRAGFGVALLERGFVQKMRPLLRIPEDWYDQGLLTERGQVRRVVVSAVAPASASSELLPIELDAGRKKVELELVPQGTLAERIRAGRAGIPAFYTPTGVGTLLATGKEIREFRGQACLLEEAIRGDFSLIRAHKADRLGNLVYKGTARTFNATMAGASTVTIAEVDEVVDVGELDPEHIVTPSPYVDRVVVRPRQARPWDQSS